MIPEAEAVEAIAVEDDCARFPAASVDDPAALKTARYARPALAAASSFDAAILVEALRVTGDQKAAVRAHRAARRGAEPTPEDATLLFSNIPLSFQCTDVAEALVESGPVRPEVADAATNAAPYSARAAVAAALSKRPG